MLCKTEMFFMFFTFETTQKKEHVNLYRQNKLNVGEFNSLCFRFIEIQTNDIDDLLLNQ